MVIKIALVLMAALLAVFVAIQFVPVQRTNPPVVTQLDWDSAQTQALAQRACMDCHSNETRWPWYGMSRRSPGWWRTTSKMGVAG